MKRSAAVLLGIIATVLCAAGPASAGGPVDRQAWSRTGAVPTFVPQQGLMYVAADVGTESARSYVHIDVSLLPSGVDTGISLSLAEADGTTFPEDAAVSACPLTSPLVASGELSADRAPTADCRSGVPLARGPDGRWTLSLDAFVASWRGGPDFGLAIVPVISGTSTFRLALDTTKTAVAVPPLSSPAVARAEARGSEAPVGSVSVPLDGDLGSPAADTIETPAQPDEPFAESAAPVAAKRPVQRVGIGPITVASPPAGIVLGIVGLAALGISVPLGRRRPRVRTEVVPLQARSVGIGAGAAAVVFLPLLFAETTVYKIGLVVILLVGAIGLHLLVNWAGELSLAHATLVGLPAFVVAKLSGDHDISPITLLPVGIAVGLVAGAVVGVPAIRARGLQVALVTLAAGVAIDRFFFTKEWLIGDVAGASVSVPSLGPITFATARSMYPFLAIVLLLSIAVAWAIYRSKLGRGLLWVKAQPDAAAAFGIPVARYRTMAYTLAGGFAGLAGGLTTMWVQRLTPDAFPLTRSFTYLIIVALAGRGFLGGVAAAAAAVEGGRLFLASGDAFITYAAPIGLILTLTQHRAGLNGFGRQIADKVRTIRGGRELAMTDVDNATTNTNQNRIGIRPLMAGGVVALALGFASIALAWYHAGNTSQVWVQNQELISGGLGGLALVIVGVGLIIYDRVLAVRAADTDRWERLIAAVESRS